jgi:hypothetical protein
MYDVQCEIKGCSKSEVPAEDAADDAALMSSLFQ